MKRIASRRAAGYSLLEVVVAMAIFGIFLAVLFGLTAEMRGWERRLPVNYMRHPQVMAVIARLRHDVLDAHGSRPYRRTHDGYTMSPTTLILETVHATGTVRMVVWDFSTPGEVRRRSYNAGALEDEWLARGVPEEFSRNFTFDAVTLAEDEEVFSSDASQQEPQRPYGVRVLAKDSNGKVAIDQILQPRAHE